MRGQHRRSLNLFLAAAAALLPACGEPGRAPAPGLRFERAVADLGTLTSGVSVTVRFPFSVAGEPVRIDQLQPGCGCLDPRLEVDGHRLPLGAPLPPGSRGEVVVEFDTTGFQGRKNTLLKVSGSGGGLPVELEVRSQLTPWLVAVPARYTPGSLTGDGPWTVDFRVTGKEPHRLLEAYGLPAGVRIEGLPSPGPALEHAFRLVIASDAPAGEHAWFLKLRADNGLSTVVPFQYRIEEEVWTRPARVVRLGSAPAGSEIYATVDLGTSRGDLTVTGYRLEGIPGARVECLNLTPAKTYRLRMVLPTGSAPGVLSGKLFLSLLHTVDGQQQDLDRQLVLAGVVE